MIHRNTDAAGQLQDIRDLIAEGVDAIVFNPNDPAALNPALDEAKAAGHQDRRPSTQYVTDPDTYNLFNNQVKYAELGAKWLFDKLGGKGTVYYMRGFAGDPADTDRDTGLQERPQGLPEHQGPPEQARASRPSGIRRSPRSSRTTSSPAATTTTIHGIWTSGMDVEVDRRHQGRRARSSCRSSARTAVASSPSSSTPRTIPASTARP